MKSTNLYIREANRPPSAEFTPTIIGTIDSCLKSVTGLWQMNVSWFESHDSITGGNNTHGELFHS